MITNNNFKYKFCINFFFEKSQPLPKMIWTKNSNNTHGFIRTTVDFSVGPKPINATGYRARTLDDKRFIYIRYFFKNLF